MKSKTGELTIDAHYPDGPKTSRQTIKVRPFPADVPLAEVSVGGSITKNLGNYESLRVNCSVTLPTAVEEIDAAYKHAWKLVEDQLTAKVKEVTGG